MRPLLGDLAILSRDQHVLEVDKNGDIIQDECGNDDGPNNDTNIPRNSQPILDTDVGDEGPAPLQNSEAPLETFDAFINVSDRSSLSTAIAGMTDTRVRHLFTNNGVDVQITDLCATFQ